MAANKPKRRSNGTFEYQFQSLELDESGRRKRTSFYMPREVRTMRKAEEIATRIQHLVDRKWLRSEPDTEVINWLGNLEGDYYEKFVRKGLAPPRIATQPDASPQEKRWLLREWVEKFIDGHSGTADTRCNLRLYARGLYHFLGTRKRGDIYLDEFTHLNAKDFANWLGKHGSDASGYRTGLALTTVRTRLRKLKGIFAAAIDDRKLSENPFNKISTAEPNKSESDYHWVAADLVERMIAESEDEDLRIMLAFARYGGLRRHELSIQLWENIDLENRCMHIVSTKTGIPARPESCDTEGRKLLIRRDVPIFDELLPHLRRHRAMTETDSRYVQSRYPRDMNITKLVQACATRTGVTIWPDFWQSMRSTRQSELEKQRFQIKAICNWLGNSPQVAQKHYLMAMEGEFDRAISGPSVIETAIAPQIAPQTVQDMSGHPALLEDTEFTDPANDGICLLVSPDALPLSYPARTRT